jgi:hypothetical protein
LVLAFADARLSVYCEDSALTVARGIQQPLEHRLLALPANQPLGPDPHHPGSMPPGSRTTGFQDSNEGCSSDDPPMSETAEGSLPDYAPVPEVGAFELNRPLCAARRRRGHGPMPGGCGSGDAARRRAATSSPTQVRFRGCSAPRGSLGRAGWKRALSLDHLDPATTAHLILWESSSAEQEPRRQSTFPRSEP